jgi:predicted Zn finger-like uncharacterized protein
MIVRCPRCGTRYRLPKRSALSADATFECTRCEHVFSADAASQEFDGPEIDAPEPPEAVRKPAPPAEDDAPDEDFAFDDEPERGWRAATRHDDDMDDDASWARRSAPKPAAAKTPKPGKRDKADRTAATARPPRSTLAFAVRCMLIVTVAYAVLSVYLYTHPDRLTDALASLPIVGPTLIETQLDPGEIELIDVKGEYRRGRDGALVFAITGQAVNHSALPVDGVQILGRIVGAETRRQVVFCGTAPRDVEDLTMREISLLQTLAPPGDWRLEPGGQANFLVAFPEPSASLTEFTAEVVAVRRRRRARAAAKDV